MIQAAPFILPIAEALGLSVATLGMAKVTDEVNKYIQENPEQAQKLITTLMPAQGIASMFKNKKRGIGDNNPPSPIKEEKPPQQEPPEGEPDLLPELTKQTAEEVIRKEIKEKQQPINKIQTWDKFLTKEEVEKASKENNIPIKDFEIPALKKQITFRKTPDGYGHYVLFDKKLVGELIEVDPLNEFGNKQGNRKTFNLFFVDEDGMNQKDAISTIDGLSFAKEKTKELVAQDLLRDTTEPLYPSLKDIFQNLEYDKKGEPKAAAEKVASTIEELEKTKKAYGGFIDKPLTGNSRYI